MLKAQRANLMTDHFKNIYNHHADQYEPLVSREDYQGNILKSLNQIQPLAGLDVVELGAGTGRLTCMLAPIVKTLTAFDASQHMLDIATAKLQQMELTNWKIAVADNCNLPLDDHIADLSIAGWSLGHTLGWFPDIWQQKIDQALAEMRRVLRVGGTAIILETLGTGFKTPTPPEPLTPYYDYLAELGFSYTWIRTDYRFESLAEAENLARFFFGDELADKVAAENWIILPECTGIWWRQTYDHL